MSMESVIKVKILSLAICRLTDQSRAAAAATTTAALVNYCTIRIIRIKVLYKIR
jgi:hypothetical protein